MLVHKSECKQREALVLGRVRTAQGLLSCPEITVASTYSKGWRGAYYMLQRERQVAPPRTNAFLRMYYFGEIDLSAPDAQQTHPINNIHAPDCHTPNAGVFWRKLDSPLLAQPSLLLFAPLQRGSRIRLRLRFASGCPRRVRVLVEKFALQFTVFAIHLLE